MVLDMLKTFELCCVVLSQNRCLLVLLIVRWVNALLFVLRWCSSRFPHIYQDSAFLFDIHRGRRTFGIKLLVKAKPEEEVVALKQVMQPGKCTSLNAEKQGTPVP